MLLGAIRSLLDRENTPACGPLRGWIGQLVEEPQAAFVLVVSGHEGQARPADRSLTALLRDDHAPFTLTRAIAISGATGERTTTTGAPN